MVRRLVQRRLLWRFAGAKSARSGGGCAARFPGRIVAALHEGLAVRGAVKHPS
jgi:hypothetical protein